MKTLKYLVLVCVVVMLCACECEKTKAYHIPEDKKMNLKVPDTLIYATADLSDYDTLYIYEKNEKFEYVQSEKDGNCIFRVYSDVITIYFKTSSGLQGNIFQKGFTKDFIVIGVITAELELIESVFAPNYVLYIGNTIINNIKYNDVYKTQSGNNLAYANFNNGIISYYNYINEKTFFQQH